MSALLLLPVLKFICAISYRCQLYAAASALLRTKIYVHAFYLKLCTRKYFSVRGIVNSMYIMYPFAISASAFNPLYFLPLSASVLDYIIRFSTEQSSCMVCCTYSALRAPQYAIAHNPSQVLHSFSSSFRHFFLSDNVIFHFLFPVCWYTQPEKQL